jgi:hypothetical protein
MEFPHFPLDESITTPVSFFCIALCLASSEAFLFVAQTSVCALFPSKSQNSTLRRHPCPRFAHRSASLCTFTFADGRRCRAPLPSRHPRLCFDHARKEAKAHPADPLDIDLSFSFSGDYVSTHDLSAAIARLLPEVTHGQIKRKTASQSPASPERCCTACNSLSTSASAQPPKPFRPDSVDAPKPMQNMRKINPRRINTYISPSKGL